MSIPEQLRQKILAYTPDAPGSNFERGIIEKFVKADPQCIGVFVEGYNALHTAAARNADDICEILLNNGADPSVRTEDAMMVTAYHIAATLGSLKVCETLEAHGAQINIANAVGRSPLHVACENNSAVICTWLLDREAKGDAVDAQDKSPFEIACERGHVECCAILQGRGYMPPANSRSVPWLNIAAAGGSVDMCKYISSLGGSVSTQDYEGKTALHAAALEGYAMVCRYLVAELGADPRGSSQVQCEVYVLLCISVLYLLCYD
jgi:ankyrin repeat protein